jgi:hypothetical protein
MSALCPICNKKLVHFSTYGICCNELVHFEHKQLYHYSYCHNPETNITTVQYYTDNVQVYVHREVIDTTEVWMDNKLMFSKRMYYPSKLAIELLNRFDKLAVMK